VYDIPDENANFEDRIKALQFKQLGDKIQVVPTFECNNLEELDIFHTRFLEDGFEGTMVRNKTGFYKCKFRSHNLLKYKSFDDAEFEIIGFTKERDTGNNLDLVVWKCITHDKSKTFNVQSKGSRTERNQLYKEGEKYIGKMLWVQFFGYTAEGIPRFPKTYREGFSSIREVIE
jgi:ATP-dependent DNA ligase